MNSNSTHIQRCLDRWQAGDRQARDDLIGAAAGRLERLARKMLKDFPGVGRWEDTGDVLQNALLRLCRALNAVQPPSSRDFFRLAAAQIRRELLDLARRYYGPQGLGAKHASRRAQPQDSTGAPEHDPSDQTSDPRRLVDWTEFHQKVDELPDEERETFDLLWYQGLTQAEAAEVLGRSTRTVKRQWQAARLKLHAALHGELPGT